MRLPETLTDPSGELWAPNDPIVLSEFQVATDKLLQERVGKIIPFIGPLLLLQPTSLEGRTRSHATSVENHFIPTDIARTSPVLGFFRSKISNLELATEEFDEMSFETGLEDYPEIIAITSHETMEDILLFTNFLHGTKLMDGKDASNLFMPLSLLLAHADFKPSGLNMATGMIAPVCNIIPVLQATKSIEPLREEFPDEVNEFNDKSTEATKKVKAQHPESKNITVMAPTASRAKMHRLIGRKISPMPDSSFTMLRKAHRDGAVIIVVGCAINPLAFVPGFPKQALRVRTPKVILPDTTLGKNEFKTEIWDALVNAAKSTSKRRIYE